MGTIKVNRKAENRSLPEQRYFFVRLKKGWDVFKQSLLGRIGMTLLVIFGIMALCSFIPPMIDPMYHPMPGVDTEISSSAGPS